ncbi:putative Hef-like homing endonuclease [Campylobacter phage PC14]|uniref:Putative Hef-like homing endonuclease n=1 Tax=Campylobacter phage PC14 TaxID=1541686 RepID=A0A1B0XVY7_9CAUD|nr:homing endonuclease [Campylobacter phage PC14]ANH51304.1 putative Hef-like homing endonuclease [Campylobacter phage PC14]
MDNNDKITYLNNLGYEVISKNLSVNLEVKCFKGHTFKRAFSVFEKGCTTCPKCKDEAKMQFLHNLGYKIISKDKNDCFEVECKHGHVFKRALSVFKKGTHSCPKCELKNKINHLHNLGFKYKSDNLVECPNGHTFKRQFSKFANGHVICPDCNKQNKLDFLKKCGYKAVSDDLTYNLMVKCPKGHIFKRTYYTFEKGTVICPECDKNKKEMYLSKLGFTIQSESLGHSLEVKCTKGHIFQRSFSNFFGKNVTYCPKCKDDEKVLIINELGYKITSENLAKYLTVECPEGHIFQRSFGHFKRGNILCPTCNPSTSSFEKEVSDLLDNYIENDYSILGDKELDFYLPGYNLAIECNGDYWHSEQMGKDKNYHLNKTEKCKEKGIQLLHIFESSWIEKKEIWKSIINNKLGKSDKIMARKCILKQVSKAEEKEFLESNHLQGFTGSSICYGLYYKDELMCLMSFGKPRFTNSYDWELIRLCTKMGLNIVGGASRLLKHFHKNNPGSLISYSDRLYSDGSIYKQLGFSFSHYSAPGYFYIKGNNKYSRQQFMKHKLKDKLERFDPNLTEYENMLLNGYNRVWDCGQGVWVKD